MFRESMGQSCIACPYSIHVPSSHTRGSLLSVIDLEFRKRPIIPLYPCRQQMRLRWNPSCASNGIGRRLLLSHGPALTPPRCAPAGLVCAGDAVQACRQRGQVRTRMLCLQAAVPRGRLWAVAGRGGLGCSSPVSVSPELDSGVERWGGVWGCRCVSDHDLSDSVSTQASSRRRSVATDSRLSWQGAHLKKASSIHCSQRQAKERSDTAQQPHGASASGVATFSNPIHTRPRSGRRPPEVFPYIRPPLALAQHHLATITYPPPPSGPLLPAL